MPALRLPFFRFRHPAIGWRNLLALTLALHGPGAGSTEPFAENEVKAAFIYNFVHFVRWPENPARKPGDAFRYCILDDNLAQLLGRAVQGEVLDGHPLSVVRQVDPRNLSDCHVLYIGEQSTIGNLSQAEVLRRAAAQHILSVSDQPGFASKGGVIALIRKRGRIHVLINTDAASRSDLRISAKLLNLATLVTDEKGGSE